MALDNQTNKGQHKYAYTYDYVGNRLEMTVTNAGGVGIHLYSCDNIYQITEVNYPDSLSYLATDTEFHYDAAGNRSSVIDGSGTCTYTSNNLNQYTAAGPAREGPWPHNGRDALGESDGSIVPQKQANKADVSVAEPVEGRGPTQGNDLPAGHVPDAEPGTREHGLQGVRAAAMRDIDLATAADRQAPEVRAV